MEKSAERAAEISADLGTFSLQEKEARTQAAGNLNLIRQRTVEAFQHAHGPTISWSLQFERKLFAAKFDEAKIQQAFVKILENAVQALGADGRVSISSRNVELTESSQDRNVRLAPGAYVCVETGDNSCGIEPDVLPRIFEPFSPRRKAGIADWDWRWLMASSPITGAEWRCPASRARALQCAFICPPRNASSKTAR